MNTNNAHVLTNNVCYASVLEKVSEYGFCTAIQEMEYGDDFIYIFYTIGLTLQNQPELFAFGLDPFKAGSMFNSIAKKMDLDENGHGFEVHDGLILKDVYDTPVALKYGSHRTKDLPLILLNNSVEYYQVVIPDAMGNFPWSEKYNRVRMDKIQPCFWDSIH